MHRYRTILLLLLAELLPASGALVPPDHETLPLQQLEQRRTAIHAKLAQLANHTLRSGSGSIGFRSQPYTTAEQAEWVKIELDRETPIDEIVLVPTLWRDSKHGFQSDGFPEEFRIIGGTAKDRTGTLLGQYSSTAGGFLPRIAPLILPIKETRVSWVRIEASRLSARAFDNLFVFELSEVLIFSGADNVALRRPVKTLTTHPGNSPSWNKRFLVDGHTPFLMDSAQGEKKTAYLAQRGKLPTLTLDLGREFPLNRIHLHEVEKSDTVPQSDASDFGMPPRLLIEGANRADFSDAVPLLETRQKTTVDAGPIMMWRIPETVCRYIRMSGSLPAPDFRMGFAEIELFSKGRNVALGKMVHTDLPPRSLNAARSPSSLTDGHNLYGTILPQRDWVEQLARRHDLERELPVVAAELAKRYARQQINVRRLVWLAVLLIAAVGLSILTERLLSRRKISKIRNQLAADLHDELGANLYTIGLLGELALAAEESPEKLNPLLKQIQLMGKRSGIAVRECTNMLEGDSLYGDLQEDMQRASERIMADLTGDISFQGGEIVEQLKPRTRIDLFLFYKECLINISRHSEATQYAVALTTTPKEICLIVCDNGQGLKDNLPPSSLKRRSRLLKAHLNVESPAEGGTKITLHLRPRRKR